MNRIMQTAASGMAAQQLNVDTIANNLANVNTPGYKKTRVEFQDLLYQTVKPAGSINEGEAVSPTELQVGTGTRPVAVRSGLAETSSARQLPASWRPVPLAEPIIKCNGPIVATDAGRFKSKRVVNELDSREPRSDAINSRFSRRAPAHAHVNRPG